MVVQNPFSNRNMITDLDEFFGRKTELMTILRRLENLQSCDVYGERKIGKSSLLYYIFKKAQVWLGADYAAAYIDMQAAENHNVESFLRNSLKELGCNSDSIISSNSLNQNLIAFSESIKELKKKKKPILLIDEFEGLTKKQEFNDDVFDTLRSLGNNGHIAYVTASLNSLKTLCEIGKFTSPFYNIFSEVKLGKFTPEETMEFLSMRGGSFGFDQGEIEFIYEVADNHPLHLQIACYHVLENKGKKWDEQKLRGDIESEIKTYEHKGVIREPDAVENKGTQPQEKSFIKSITNPATIRGLMGYTLGSILLELLAIYLTRSIEYAILILVIALIFFYLYERNKIKS